MFLVLAVSMMEKPAPFFVRMDIHVIEYGLSKRLMLKKISRVKYATGNMVFFYSTYVSILAHMGAVTINIAPIEYITSSN